MLSKVHIDVMSLIRVSTVSAIEKLIYSGAPWMGVLSQNSTNGALLVRYGKGSPSPSTETELEYKM